MPDVKDIVAELDAVCSDIKVIPPPLILDGNAVIFASELLLAVIIIINYLAVAGTPVDVTNGFSANAM